MPDIAMCQDHDCPSSKMCYRHQAWPNGYAQSYGEFDRKGKDKCEQFWRLKNDK